MLEDFISEKIGDASKAIKKYRGEAVPEEQANSIRQEIISTLETVPEEWNITLEQELRLFIPQFFIKRDPNGPKYYDSMEMNKIKVFITAPNYKPENPIPLVIYTFDMISNPEELKIKNLRRFLGDYQERTHTWIGAKDILNAKVKEIRMDFKYRGKDELVLTCEM